MRGSRLVLPLLGRLTLSCCGAIPLLIGPPPALAQCPQTSLRFPTLGPLVTDEQTFDVTSPDQGWSRGDHRTGVFSLHHSGALAPTVITARDRFDVTGVPSGTRVDLTMRFLVDGWVYTGGCGGSGCCGIAACTVRAGGDSAAVTLGGHTFGGRRDFGGIVELPVSLVAGTPRDLEVEIYARRCPGGGHTVDATGRIEFVGTDELASVVSCKGFGPTSVPVLHRTWGRIKTIYR